MPGQQKVAEVQKAAVQLELLVSQLAPTEVLKVEVPATALAPAVLASLQLPAASSTHGNYNKIAQSNLGKAVLAYAANSDQIYD